MQGSTYNPENRYQYEKTKLQVNNLGLETDCPVSSITNLDYTLTDDCLLVGIFFACKNQTWGDKISLSVLTNLGVTVLTFVTDWRIVDDSQVQFNEEATFPAKIPAGYTIRFAYNNLSQNNVVKLIVNLRMHKILI